MDWNDLRKDCPPPTEVVLLTDGQKKWAGIVFEVEGDFFSCLHHPEYASPYPYCLNPFHLTLSPTHYLKIPPFQKGVADDFGTDPIYGEAIKKPTK